MIRAQRTIKKEVSFSGIGLHTGKEVYLRFLPAKADSGIVFQRVDLKEKPIIEASLNNVTETNRSTTIGKGTAFVQTVEHVMAALYAMNIDNICVQVNAGEPPICDGSSNIFVNLIHEAGILEQKELASYFEIEQPIYLSHNETHLIALPSNDFKISYTLHYPKNKIIQSQYFSTIVTEEIFQKEIAFSRTFALYEEITFLMEKGLIKGGSLENAVVIKEDGIVNKEGLRAPNEMVRHKVLDLIGDLALLGFHFKAHVIAICSGHSSNVAFGKKIAESLASNKSYAGIH